VRGASPEFEDPEARLAAQDTSPLGLELEHALTHERHRALRALLQRPLLSATGPFATDFLAVRRHAQWLRDWLERNTGWRLRLDSETARLHKTPAELADATRGACDPTGGQPFSRGRYVLFCLALAALEGEERQTVLGNVADKIVAMAGSDPSLEQAGFVFELESQEQRRDLVQVMRLLLDLRVLERVSGEEERFVDGRGDVLYTVHRSALAAVPSFLRPPSSILAGSVEQRLRELTSDFLPPGDEGRTRRLRWSLTRRLVDDPVLYYDSLDERERAYLNSQRSLILSQIREATGLVPEVRAEGIAMADVSGDATDLGLPEEGTDGHVTLLLAEFLAAHLRRHPEGPVGLAALRRHTAELANRHRALWRRDATLPGSEAVLVEQTLERLEALRLVRREEDVVWPLAAIARYALEEPREGRRPTRLPRAGLKPRRARK
jgi:uncharacterized protein (TIGR02678 family)